jgi:hypothetical protein
MAIPARRRAADAASRSYSRCFDSPQHDEKPEALRTGILRAAALGMTMNGIGTNEPIELVEPIDVVATKIPASIAPLEGETVA